MEQTLNAVSTLTMLETTLRLWHEPVILPAGEYFIVMFN